MEEIIEKSETVDEANGDISAGKELEAPTCEKTNAVQHENESHFEESDDAGEEQMNCESRHKVVSDHIELGKRGERAARAFLERHGLDILEMNWECPAGEVDIVAWDGYALRFVEVKTRRGTGKGFPEEAVNAEKRARYERIAEYYLRDFDKVDIPIFFDIIGIVATGGGRAFLRYHRDAFGRDYVQ